tara:strand:+ start:5854 stop:6051 length:198 start_codon:yes stop_codon:yes gene_type:complete
MKILIDKLLGWLFKWNNEETVVHTLYQDNEYLKNQIKFYQKDLERALKTMNRLRDELESLTNSQK